MNGKHYNLRILPLFEDDLNEILDYISFHLHNPSAADTLIDDVEDETKSACIFRTLLSHTLPQENVNTFTIPFKSGITRFSTW